jgi:outer membrane protein OmpA-like peptidoglycan-associated protein
MPDSTGVVPPPGADYSGARANLRETVKWLVTSFSSIVALVVAGGALSGLTNVDYRSGAFYWGMAALVIAFGLSLGAIGMILNVLQQDGVFASHLKEPVLVPGVKVSHPEPKFMAAVRGIIRQRHDDLLPAGVVTADKLVDARNEIRDEIAQTQAAGKVVEADRVERLRSYESRLFKLLQFAQYQRLSLHLSAIRWPLMWLGVAVVLLLAVFSCGVNMARIRSDSQPAVFLVNQPPSKDPVLEEVALAPVLFSAGSFQVRTEQMNAVTAARNFLKRYGDYSLLLRAHTDTTASERLNARLAKQRGDEVRRLLLQPGGIPGSHVFVSDLPKQDLPIPTVDQVPDELNRSVEFFVARIAKAVVAASQK